MFTMASDYLQTIIEYWKPQVQDGMFFFYLFFLIFGIALGYLFYQIMLWIFKGIKPGWAQKETWQ